MGNQCTMLGDMTDTTGTATSGENHEKGRERAKGTGRNQVWQQLGGVVVPIALFLVLRFILITVGVSEHSNLLALTIIISSRWGWPIVRDYRKEQRISKAARSELFLILCLGLLLLASMVGLVGCS